MANEQALRFVEAVRTDEAIRAELQSARARGDVVSIGVRHGFRFTVEELVSVRSELAAALQAAAGELSDERLDQVAGGIGTLTPDAIDPADSVGAMTSDEIYTDKYGRIKVQFNWDRD
jgi:predicted ribosomally synthesized peptide with nif11-like leader